MGDRARPPLVRGRKPRPRRRRDPALPDTWTAGTWKTPSDDPAPRVSARHEPKGQLPLPALAAPEGDAAREHHGLLPRLGSPPHQLTGLHAVPLSGAGLLRLGISRLGAAEPRLATLARTCGPGIGDPAAPAEGASGRSAATNPARGAASGPAARAASALIRWTASFRPVNCVTGGCPHSSTTSPTTSWPLSSVPSRHLSPLPLPWLPPPPPPPAPHTHHAYRILSCLVI